MNTKYVFVTGGVASSLGKGIIAASLAKLLQARGLRVTIQKFDPYINIDPGTLNPYEHGECYVTDDGAETDLDLGHYERFLGVHMTKANNVTTGKVYFTVINKEREGAYLGKTVQIIPHITDTTNNILGQMTGGTMGVEFVMERTVKGKDGDKATLDVLINEYGKTTLPYASKSGGEKVKASLAVILALSEIKATAAGIQLGMLFIDEPPFLDDEGAQAYVDALETIRDRYSDVKIMAITHDDAMKARFGQAVTVIKTDDGSKVIY